MINQARDEREGVMRLRLARANPSNVSNPSRPAVMIESGSSIDRNCIPENPDPRTKSASGIQILGNIGITELLEQDERPTFIIDVMNPANFNPGSPLQIVYANANLRGRETLFEMITGNTDFESPGIAVTNDFPAFKSWALSFVVHGDSQEIPLPQYHYSGVAWTCNILRKRLRVISGHSSASASVGSNGILTGSSVFSDRNRVDKRNSVGPSPLVQCTETSDYFGNVALSVSADSKSPDQYARSNTSKSRSSVSPDQAVMATQPESIPTDSIPVRHPENLSFDWTSLPMSPALPRHIRFARSINWAATALGPIENWTFELRAMSNLIMGSPHPAAMYWGDDSVAIYNEAYILLAGKKHPTLMGQSFKESWGEIWSDVKDAFDRAKESGRSTMKDDDCLFINRNGYLEESYFSWSIVPLIGRDGSIAGLYNPAFDKTRRNLSERRMLTLREVGERTAAAREVKAFWGQVIKGLEYNEYDAPFAFIYSVSEDGDSDISSINSGSLAHSPQCILEGTLGVPEGHQATQSPLDLKTSEETFVPYFRESMRTNKQLILNTEDGTMPSDLIEGLHWRGFGDKCRAAVVCPIQPTTGEAVLGFLVIGVNPRRSYDDDYSLFIQLLTRQLATSMASVVLFEEEIRRGQKAARMAALDRQELYKQLDLRTQEAAESETKFTRMAEFAPVGMFIANSNGEITYSNDTWWQISRHTRSQNSTTSWMDSIKDQDREGVRHIWKMLVENKTAVTHEFRFQAPWQDRNGIKGDTWVLMSAYPERDCKGKLKSVFGSITNISQQKWAEDFQKQRMEEAMEMKRQQENFIDMTSHEMRNPLSAILQCSDEIIGSLQAYKKSEHSNSSAETVVHILDSSIDAAQTIALCAQHQKRIVDDILTLSKLDSALLMVTPIAVQPVTVVQRVLKMFEGELDTNDIAMEFRMEKSYTDLSIDWVKIDPSRLLQVLINLTTNAIKFTHGQQKRSIIVSIGASKDRRGNKFPRITYFPSRSKQKDLTTDKSEWGDGEELYLHFTVQDTGLGLDDKEKTLLFQRFSQASPRTHVQYGGSGLGLFISRELTELQGGEIGVFSEPGVGSTFAFYIKARRVDDMSKDTPIATTIKSLRLKTSPTNTSSVILKSREISSSRASRQSKAEATPKPMLGVELQTPSAWPVVMDHSKLRVLIVEDNLVNQRVLRKQLKNIGFQTEVANHGGEAIDYLKSSRFWKGKEEDGVELAVILMDLEMPFMDGLTCARQIRDAEAAGKIVKHVPIIAVTANARSEQIETAMTVGMDDVVSKPFRIQELVPKIEELVITSTAS